MGVSVSKDIQPFKEMAFAYCLLHGCMMILEGQAFSEMALPPHRKEPEPWASDSGGCLVIKRIVLCQFQCQGYE